MKVGYEKFSDYQRKRFVCTKRIEGLVFGGRPWMLEKCTVLIFAFRLRFEEISD